KDQVVELFPRGQRQSAERFRLVALAVAEERPDTLESRLLQAASFQVTVVAGLVDRHDWAEAHRNCRKLPEIRHQPRMRIRRQAAARLQFTAEILHLRFAETAFEEGA